MPPWAPICLRISSRPAQRPAHRFNPLGLNPPVNQCSRAWLTRRIPLNRKTIVPFTSPMPRWIASNFPCAGPCYARWPEFRVARRACPGGGPRLQDRPHEVAAERVQPRGERGASADLKIGCWGTGVTAGAVSIDNMGICRKGYEYPARLSACGWQARLAHGLVLA